MHTVTRTQSHAYTHSHTHTHSRVCFHRMYGAHRLLIQAQSLRFFHIFTEIWRALSVCPHPAVSTISKCSGGSTCCRPLPVIVCSLCFSAINGSGPAYLSELLHVYTPYRKLRSSSDTRMLEIQQYKRKTHGFRTFSCFGPHIWNSLPQNLRHCSTPSSFKAKLKTFLFSQYFHPN